MRALVAQTGMTMVTLLDPLLFLVAAVQTWEGQFDEDGLPHGKGVMTYPPPPAGDDGEEKPGDKYEGEMVSSAQYCAVGNSTCDASAFSRCILKCAFAACFRPSFRRLLQRHRLQPPLNDKSVGSVTAPNLQCPHS